MDEFQKTFRDLLLIFAGSSLAGLANLLWEGRRITRARKVGAVLMSGFAGLIVWLLLYERLKDTPLPLAGVALLAGIGGASTLDALSAWLWRKLGTNDHDAGGTQN